MPNVLVTGTSTGIGQACAIRLAARGWTVFAGLRRAEDADRLRAQIAGDVRPLILDVCDRADLARAIASVTDAVGPQGLQGLVNNAGIAVGGPVEHVREDEWRAVFEVNFFGVVALSQAALPLLRAGTGRIVHIGSIAGRLSSAGVGPYCATKHAIVALAETQRLELGRLRPPLRVALIEPGEVKTAIWDKAESTADQIDQRLDAAARADYQWLVDQARGFIEEGREKGVDATKVADAVEHALTADRPKARYLVGPDAKVGGHVVARLPGRLRDAVEGLGSNSWEKRGRKLRDGATR